MVVLDVVLGKKKSDPESQFGRFSYPRLEWSSFMCSSGTYTVSVLHLNISLNWNLS